MEGNPLDSIPLVTISPQGMFKYILITAKIDHSGKQSQKTYVRGIDGLEYHLDNLASFLFEVKTQGFQIKKKNLDYGSFEAVKGPYHIAFKCPGGGRI